MIDHGGLCQTGIKKTKQKQPVSEWVNVYQSQTVIETVSEWVSAHQSQIVTETDIFMIV